MNVMMKAYFSPPLVIFLLFCSTVAAQMAPDESERLRGLVGFAQGTVVVVTPLDKLPVDRRVFRVFLAVGSEKSRRDYYARKIKEWNRRKLRHLASLKIVERQDQADIVLARDELSDKPEKSTRSTLVFEQEFHPSPIAGGKQVKHTQTYLTVRAKVYVLRPLGDRIEVLREVLYEETRKEGKIEPVTDMLWISLLTLLSGP
jgi:hypothetical protein